MSLGLRSRKIIFVHGIFGWGKGELPISYWGDALKQFDGSRFETHEVKCGPVSSFHDRACEVFAQIKGGDFVYANAPSAEKRAVVPRDDRNVAGPLLPDWSADNPVILVGHSAGAHTCLALQRLLKDDFFGVGSNADWIEAVISISGVLNGATLAYMLGCDPVTGVLTGNRQRLIDTAVNIATFVPTIPRAGIEPWLEQWNNPNAFTSGKDNLAFDLTLQGCHAANAAFSTNPSTTYLSLVTSMPERSTFFGFFSVPPRGINLLLVGSEHYQAKTVNFAPGAPPLANWGTPPDLVIDAWRENDGAVSAISQRFPFTHHPEPFGGEGIFNRASIEKGKWYFEGVENVTGQHFDHLDPGFGIVLKPDAAAAQRVLYQRLAALL